MKEKTNFYAYTSFVVIIVFCLLTMSFAVAGEKAENTFRPGHILSLAEDVYEYTLSNPYVHRTTGEVVETDRNWIRATFYTGVMELYHATGYVKFLEQANRWAEKHEWQVGTEGSGYNKLFCAMTWVQLYLNDPDQEKINPTIEWLEADAPNSPGGAEVWYGHAPPPFDEPLYCDALYGSPIFPMLYKATGEQKYLELLHDSFWNVTETLLDEEDDLYYRDPGYIGSKTENDEKILWSRGSGWVFGAFPRLLRYLPKEDPYYDKYVDLYQRMAMSLAARQLDDGYWRANLADPLHYTMPETSGTAFFIAGLAWGVREGLLDQETYLPVVIRGWKALVDAVQPNGKLGWVQPVGAAPAASSYYLTHEYATGLFLSSAGQVYLLVRDGIITQDMVNSILGTF